ncbi:MAG TPA: iron-containing redox enzyme family protein [Candidatus Binatia bacterium]|nr:iron-containing redox enzyme family protein [Candidatus Binatia bacterium]
MSTTAFKNVIKSGPIEAPEPVDHYLSALDRMIAEIMWTRDRITAAIGNGSAPLALVKRIAKEYYYLGRWMTPDFATFIANAPDAFSLTMDYSEHYAHWCQNFADEAGYLRDPNHVSMKWEWCQQLGIGAEELESYTPLPETIAVTFTMLYYVRRSYEEGLAVFGFAGERLAARSGYAKTMYEGLKQHYGMTVKNFEVHAYAEPDHGDKAEALFRKVVTTASVQRRCREAIRNVMLVREARTKALNALLD